MENKFESFEVSKSCAPLPKAKQRVLEVLRSVAIPVRQEELASSLKIHENTLREHLTYLLEAGLVTRTPLRSNKKGRPAWLWQATATASGNEYSELATILAISLAKAGNEPEKIAREAGVSWGRSLVSQPHDAIPEKSQSIKLGTEQLKKLLRNLGYAPIIEEVSKQRSEISLHHCPLWAAAKQAPEVVCNLHLGLVVGALEAIGLSAEESTLTPRLPAAPCQLKLFFAEAG